MRPQLKTPVFVACYFVVVAICWTFIHDDLARIFGAPAIAELNGFEFVAGLFLIASSIWIVRVTSFPTSSSQ